ncbi:MAG: hypothetical protein Q7J64_01985 [Elusimicrobiota bacterium]|nr:hypothetical protein [Elusimicrobiota bacterium]
MPPQRIVTLGGASPVRLIAADQLPEVIRSSRINEFPDPGQLEAGDFLLFQSTVSRVVPNAIERFQLLQGHSPEHARWYHAGIYAGGFLVCDAQRSGGVKLRSLISFTQGHNWRILRLKPGLGSPVAVLNEAKRYMGKSYAYWKIPFAMLGIALPDQARQGAICSTLCADALFESAGEAFTEKPVALPADISASGLLDEVQVDVVGRLR